jgi:RND family efflux transporter MFP subunit
MENGPRAERIRVAESEVAQSKAMVAKAKGNLDHATLTAPISGIVLERHGEVGENIRPDALASGVYVLADLSRLEVQVDVEEQSLGKLKVGQPCRIIPDAYSDKTYAAKISRWQPQVNRARAVVRVILTITEPDDLLLAEMNCRAVILASAETPEPETYWIPTSASLTEEGQTKVFVIEENAARARTVTLGTIKDNHVQVLSGLSKTDRVVLPGENPPVDGQKMP